MKEKGRVTEVYGLRAKINLEPSEACKHCHASAFCQPAGNARVIEAENSIGANIGDEVYIEILARTGFIAIFFVFCLPVMLGLIGLLLGAQYSNTHSIFYGLVGFALGLLIAKIVNDILRKKHKFLPKIIEIVRPKDA